ncbi:MAG: hypothetical protein Q4F00_13530 [bacterium]|nr:hypothetical protein [bacterium]
MCNKKFDPNNLSLSQILDLVFFCVVFAFVFWNYINPKEDIKNVENKDKPSLAEEQTPEPAKEDNYLQVTSVYCKIKVLKVAK